MKTKNTLIAYIGPYKKLNISQQTASKEIILKLFKEFWKQNPSEKEFADFASGLVVFPEMIYFMIKRRGRISK